MSAATQHQHGHGADPRVRQGAGAHAGDGASSHHDHGESGDHGSARAHEGHDKHEGHSPEMFSDRFWLSLVLSVPAEAFIARTNFRRFTTLLQRVLYESEGPPLIR